MKGRGFRGGGTPEALKGSGTSVGRMGSRYIRKTYFKFINSRFESIPSNAQIW
jgi:hypothetical protein